MAQYETREVGVWDNVAAALVTPADYSAWAAYIDWLAAGNVADPMPPPPVQPLSDQRAEALARLDRDLWQRRKVSTVLAGGHTWAVDESFLILLLMHRASFPPVPPGFTLPDITRTQVPLNLVQVDAIIAAISQRLRDFNTRFAVLVALLTASATPLAEDITTGWPP